MWCDFLFLPFEEICYSKWQNGFESFGKYHTPYLHHAKKRGSSNFLIILHLSECQMGHRKGKVKLTGPDPVFVS